MWSNAETTSRWVFQHFDSIVNIKCSKNIRRDLKVAAIRFREENLEERKEQLEKIIRLNKIVEEKDTSLYHSHIIHAFAFAVKGHWNSTLALAKIAIAISDNIEQSNEEFRLW